MITMAFGDDGKTGGSKIEIDTLTSLLLDSMGQNLKLYGINIINYRNKSN